MIIEGNSKFNIICYTYNFSTYIYKEMVVFVGHKEYVFCRVSLSMDMTDSLTNFIKN